MEGAIHPRYRLVNRPATPPIIFEAACRSPAQRNRTPFHFSAGPAFFAALSPAASTKPLAEADGVRPDYVDDWKRFLRGLWLSGLRLEEAIDLWWDRDDRIHVDLSGRDLVLLIHADQEKGGQDRLLPIAPELAELLLTVPQLDRTGQVFALPYTRKDTVSRIVSAIGAAAGIKVNTDPRTGKVKFASAHDLRRSFGERWSARVMPQILMQLMRHESIETTMRYYVGRNAQSVAKVLREAMGGSDTSGDNSLSGQPQIDVTS